MFTSHLMLKSFQAYVTQEKFQNFFSKVFAYTKVEYIINFNSFSKYMNFNNDQTEVV